MAKSDNRKRRNTKWYIDKYKALGFEMDHIITLYFLQDEYPSVPETDTAGINIYSGYCTNRDSFYTEGGLCL